MNELCRSHWSAAGHGSNNWVVAPSRSATGRAILCNDPHLRLTIPSIWYLMHLPKHRRPGLMVTRCGAPQSQVLRVFNSVIIVGFLGVTAAICDDVELYREKPHPLDPDRYLTRDRWLAYGKARRNHQSGAQRRNQKNRSINLPWAGA